MPEYLPGGIRIEHEDKDILVVDKPTGIVTATQPGDDLESVFRAVKIHVRNKIKRRGTQVWIIHRLDKEASGLLVFAKTAAAFEWLKEQFRSKRVHRLYSAVVEGEIAPTASPAQAAAGISQLPSGTIQSFLVEDADGRVYSTDRPTQRKSTDESEAKLAVTHYRVAATGNGRSLLQVRLETGRKNQIRVHMKESGHPIVGDRRYGAKSDPLERVCLHAAELGFTHPTSGQTVRFRSSIPASFFKLVGKKVSDLPQTVEAAPATAPPPSPVRITENQHAITPAAPPASWDHVAGWYNSLLEDKGSDHHERVIIPGTLRLLSARKDDRVLDVACGQGIMCRRLTAIGAAAVGVDASAKLISAAKGLASGPGEAQFYVADARELDSLQIGTFNKACCVMALMNIDPLSAVLRGVADKLSEGGILVAVALHPAFRAPGQTSWGWAPASDGASPVADSRTRAPRTRNGARPRVVEKQFRRVDGYLSNSQREIVMNPGAAAKGNPAITTVTYHRPLQHYIHAFSQAGFLVQEMEEWPSLRQSEPGPRAEEENRARREIPMFVAWSAVKARPPIAQV